MKKRTRATSVPCANWKRNRGWEVTALEGGKVSIRIPNPLVNKQETGWQDFTMSTQVAKQLLSLGMHLDHRPWFSDLKVRKERNKHFRKASTVILDIRQGTRIFVIDLAKYVYALKVQGVITEKEADETLEKNRIMAL